MSLGPAAEWIVRKGLGKPTTVDDLLKVLQQTQELELVHLCDNVMNKPTYVCSCCGCCCHVLRDINEKQVFVTHPSNFMPSIELQSCAGCGICSDSCQIHAITMTDQGDGVKVPVVNTDICIGCGVCASACPMDSMTMSRRSVLLIPPENLKEKFTRMAKEKGRG